MGDIRFVPVFVNLFCIRSLAPVAHPEFSSSICMNVVLSRLGGKTTPITSAYSFC